MSTLYIVRTPIHGYSGMGYESTSHLEHTFADEDTARKWLSRVNKAWELYDLQDHWYPGCDPSHARLWTEAERVFMREMTDNVCYSFRGPSTLSRQQILEEVLDSDGAAVQSPIP